MDDACRFIRVLNKVSQIPVDNFTINIELFQQTFTRVELLRYKHIPHVELFRWLPLNFSNRFHKYWTHSTALECLKSSTTHEQTFVLRFTFWYSTLSYSLFYSRLSPKISEISQINLDLNEKSDKKWQKRNFKHILKIVNIWSIFDEDISLLSF